MIDLTKPLETRSGNRVELLCTDLTGSYPILAKVYRDGEVDAVTFTATGLLYEDDKTESDLVNTPVQHTRYAQVFPCATVGASVQDMPRSRSQNHGHSRIGVVRIDVVEGREPTFTFIKDTE